MAEKFIVNSQRTYDEFAEAAKQLWEKYRYLRVTVLPGANRSIDQNSMFFELYTHIADWFYGGDVELARAECKLDYGMKILRADDPAMNELCSRSLDLLTREEQLQFIRGMSVTSDMTRQQATVCINAIMDAYAEQGLIWPDYLTRNRKQLRREAA